MLYKRNHPQYIKNIETVATNIRIDKQLKEGERLMHDPDAKTYDNFQEVLDEPGIQE